MGRKRNKAAATDEDYFASLTAETNADNDPATRPVASPPSPEAAEKPEGREKEALAAAAAAETAEPAGEGEDPEASALGRRLYALRLKREPGGPDDPFLWTWFCWWLLSLLASTALLRGIDQKLLATADARAAAREAEAERLEAHNQRHCLWSQKREAWLPRGHVMRVESEAEVPSIQYSDEKKSFLRWRKGPHNTGVWMRARPEEGWATAPEKLDATQAGLWMADVKFFAILSYPESNEDRRGRKARGILECFECTEWVKAELSVNEQDIIHLGFVDNAKPFFKLNVGREGVEVSLMPKMRDKINANREYSDASDGSVD